MAEGSGWQNLLASASSAGASLGWRIGGFDSDVLPEPVGIAG